MAAGLMSGAASADDIKIGYINKMGDHPWFVAEVGGAKKAAEAAGAAFVSQDVQFDANLTITTFDTMVGDGVKGIAIVVPDKALGPVIAEKAKAAKIPLVAVDDDIYYEDGTQVPYVGMNAYNIGARVGEELAKLYKADGWAGKEVRIASIEDRKADTCMQRNKGAEGSIPEGGARFQAGQYRSPLLRQHDGQRHRRDDHHIDGQSQRHELDILFMQR
ncbi:substrate-binding domain-containing protein [Mesorhizobium sp. M0220]|uniref:substrate-binding domain-containing protein n=1 Tax=Mesorhizobium sp. M0220 TaxID=2956920 RepID=UPI00333D3DD8